MRIALAFLRLVSAGASAQTLPPVRALTVLGVGSASDSLGGLVAFQAALGVRSGAATARLRGTAASDLALFGSRARWEAAALGGVTLGDRARVFLGAGPGLTGGSVRPSCFLSSRPCETRVSPHTLGLALALEAMVEASRVVRVGVQGWANVNRNSPVSGIGVAVGVGR